jgi:uncharacterized protein
MKKLLLIIIAVLLLTCTVSAQGEYVKDTSGRLKNCEDELNISAGEFFENHQIGIYMVTVQYSTGDIDGDADRFYHANGFGKGEEKSGIMLYVAVIDREYSIYAYGKAMDMFDSDAFDYVEDNILEYLSDTDFESAYTEFYTSSEYIVSLYEQGTPYKTPFNYVLWIVAALIVGGIAGFIYVSGLKGSMNTVRANDHASRYALDGSFKVSNSRDMLVFKTITRVRKLQNNSSGGTRSSVGGGSFSSRSGRF